MASDNQHVYQIIFSNEKIADKILQNKQLIVEYDKKRQGNREALRALRKSDEKDVWMTVGSMLIEMSRLSAIDMLTEEHAKIEKEIDRLRDEQMVLMKEHKNLEMDEIPKGFDLQPLGRKEMTALKNNLKL